MTISQAAALVAVIGGVTTGSLAILNNRYVQQRDINTTVVSKPVYDAEQRDVRSQLQAIQKTQAETGNDIKELLRRTPR